MSSRLLNSRSGGAFEYKPPEKRAAVAPRRNQLLAMLPSLQLNALVPHLELVYLTRGTCLCESARPLTHVYFPTRGVVSLGYAAANGDTADLALVGAEGVIGVEAFLGSERSSYRAVVQTICVAYSLRVSVARSRFAEGGALQQALLKYALSLLLNVSQTSICNLHHTLEQRLCRSLLQAVDRVASNTLLLTQDVLAGLVGARRQGISEAVNNLRDSRLVRCERGSITVLDRAGLAARACECYVVLKAHMERLLGGL
jgi:CRP-like cAMP-binding protein